MVSERIPDALFGVDGTEASELLSDPSGRAGWRDTPILLPLPLPAIPNPWLTQDAVAAGFGDQPAAPVDHEPTTAPAQHSAAAPNATSPTVTQNKVAQDKVAQPNAGQPNAAQPDAVPGAVPPPAAPPPNAPQSTTPPTAPFPTAPPASSAQPAAPQPPDTAPQPAARAGESAPPTGEPVRRPRLTDRTSGPSGQPPLRSRVAPRYRPPLAAGSRTSPRLAGRRQVLRRGPSLPIRTRRVWSDGGAGAFFIIATVIVVVLAYNIIMGFVEAISRLIP